MASLGTVEIELSLPGVVCPLRSKSMRTLVLAAFALIMAGANGNASGVGNAESWHQQARATIGRQQQRGSFRTEEM